MCIMDAPDMPATPEPAPPPPPPDQTKLELRTKAPRKSDELSAKAKGTRKYRNDLTSGGGLSGLNIPM